ncbi:MAG: flagellar hook protein FlgE [Thiohalomonadaceae bacterium]
MSFQTALSGLNAASGNLNVTGHNIANASTTGFKYSRAEFADVYAVSFGGVAKTATGSGVRLANVAQQFTQGNVDFTDNNLDLAVSGEGFFMLSDNGSRVYSRAGNFSVDRDGYVVNANGHRLQAYDVDPATGAVSNFTPNDLRLNLGANPAKMTEEIGINLNLDAAATLASVQPMDVHDPDSYNFSTTTTIYDSLGVTHDATLYFQKASATTQLNLTGSLFDNGGTPGSPESIPVFQVYDSLGNAYAADISFTQTGPDSYTAAVTLGSVTRDITLDFTSGVAQVVPSGDNVFSNLDLDSTGSGQPSHLTIDFSALTRTTDASTGTTAEIGSRSDNGPQGVWNVRMVIDGQEFDNETIAFNKDGSLGNNPPYMSFNTSGAFVPGNNALDMDVVVNFTGSTQFGAASAVNNLIQDGWTTGRLSGVSVDAGGVVYARYTNGQSEVLGAVAMARFSNPNGLQQMGDTNWAESFESGGAQLGQAGTGTFGQIQSGALEASNVDISKQLVNMIIAQRDFQANAKMISTEDTVTQTIINIR